MNLLTGASLLALAKSIIIYYHNSRKLKNFFQCGNLSWNLQLIPVDFELLPSQYFKISRAVDKYIVILGHFSNVKSYF